MKSVLLLLLFLPLSIMAQKADTTILKGMNMRNIGPAGMSGRVTCIDVSLKNKNVIVVGTASGGLWLSETGGMTWTPLMDDQPVLSIGSVAINQSNPSVIWAGTGEGNPRNSQSSGKGIYKSVDGGHSWKLMGLENTKVIHRIVINPQNPDEVLAAALGSAWGPNKERGVFKTSDGGITWKKVLFVNDSTGCADLVMDPSNPNKLIAAMWQYNRQPWFFNSGGKGSGLYISFDAGEHWVKRTEKDGLPEGNLGRIGLAIAPSNPKICYALIESKKTGLYKSDDGGYNWYVTATKNIGNRPFYYADIYPDPKDENTLYNLWSTVTVSIDGGKTFSSFMGWNNAHPDHHAFWIDPENSKYIIDGNDGGLNITHDGGETWHMAQNLPLGQFYHINYDMDIPYNVYGGMQDNGSWKGPSKAFQYGGLKNSEWQELVFGDGFDVVPYIPDSRYGMAMYQGGNVYRYDTYTGNSQYVQPVHPEGTYLRFNWNAAISADPSNTCGVFMGSQYLHYSADCGQSWEIISPDLTTNDSTKQQQIKSGGLTIDATRAENYTTIVAISPDPLDNNTIWVGTDDGNLQLTRDHGKTWDNLSSKIKSFPKGAWIPQIEVSKVHPGEVMVVVHDYMRNNWKPYVFKTTDYGAHWTTLVDETKVEGYCHAIVQDSIAPNLLFLGTEQGLYVSCDAGKNWTKWTDDFPSVSTIDLKIHPREDDLIIGTFGRAAWILDDITPLRELATKGTAILENNLYMFKPHDARIVANSQPKGPRFNSSSEYEGENSWYGAKIQLYIKQLGQPKNAEGKPDTTFNHYNWEKVRISVFNNLGDSVISYTTKSDTGLNIFTWSLNRKSSRMPSWNKPAKDANPSGYWTVLPDKYKVVVHYGAYADSNTVTVLTDPRLTYNEKDRKDRLSYEIILDSIVNKATSAMDRLLDFSETIDLVTKQLSNVPDSVKKDLIKKSAKLKDSIKDIEDEILLSNEFIGYDHISIRLGNLLWNTYSYIQGTYGAIGKNAITELNLARKETNRILQEINIFSENEWALWQKEVENVQYSLFKDYQPLDLK